MNDVRLEDGVRSVLPPLQFSPSVQVGGSAAVPLETAWARFVPIDLTKLFTGLGPLPAVTQVAEQTQNWNIVGATRRVDLSDNTAVQEEITLVDISDTLIRFGYTVSGFSGVFGHLTREAHGVWVFQHSTAGTNITWRYAFRPNTFVARPVMSLLTHTLWQSYMKQALNRTIDILEAG